MPNERRANGATCTEISTAFARGDVFIADVRQMTGEQSDELRSTITFGSPVKLHRCHAWRVADDVQVNLELCTMLNRNVLTFFQKHIINLNFKFCLPIQYYMALLAVQV